MKKIILSVAMLFLTHAAFAQETVVVKEGGIPVTIQVDPTANTYSVVGTAPTSGEFYYTYPGYRCYREKLTTVTSEGVVYSSAVAGGSTIYCYPQ